MKFSIFWTSFYTVLPLDLKIQWILFLTLFVKLLLCHPPCLPVHHSVHVRPALNSCDHCPVLTQCTATLTPSPLTPSTPRPRQLHYTRDQLLRIPECPLDPSLAASLRHLGIGYGLPRVRTHRGGRRKQRKINVIASQTFTGRTKSETQAGKTVNIGNLISVPIVPSTSIPKNICVAHFNAQSVGRKEKRTAINDFIQDREVDVLCVTESWLRDAGDEAKLKDLGPPGYTATSFPRMSGRGGGIAVVVSDQLCPHGSFTAEFPFEHSSFELCQFTVSLPQQCPLNVICLYRPPPSKRNRLSDSLFLQQITDLFEYTNSLKGSLLILGDFNYHFDSPNASCLRLLDVADMFSLSQSVSTPTHIGGHIIDWVLCREQEHLLNSTTVDPTLSSDHWCVLCQLNFSKPLNPCSFREVRKLSSINIDYFNNDLLSHPALSSEPSADQLFQALRDTLDNHAPATRRQVCNRPPSPWYSSVDPELRVAKRERRKAESLWRLSGLHVHRQIFQAARNTVTDIVQKAKSMYYSAQILACTTSKQLFCVANSLLGKNLKSPLPTQFSAHDLPQKFADFFSNKISSIREKLDSVIPPPLSFEEKRFHGNVLSFFQPVSEQYVKELCLKAAPKSCELDPLPTKLFCDSLDHIIPHVTHVINQSLISGSFPSMFKKAIVRPLLKKPMLDSNCLKNYRPVSNLSFLSKITEKVVLSQVLSHLQDNNLLNPFQSAYRTGHSTETALLRIVNDLLVALDNNNVSVLALLDLSAAFDTIDHSILLTRLENSFGICGSALKWFESYLSDRKQRVCTNNHYSDPVSVEYGVPQGSVLGPILFVLYATPISQIINHHSLSHQSFADDTQLHDSSHISQVDHLLERIQNCATDLKTWMCRNKLQLNDEKTELLLVTPKRFQDDPSLPSSLKINSADVSFSPSVRSLGVLLDQNLSFQQQVSSICKTAYLELRRISSIRHYLSADTTKSLICAFVLSRIDYCNSLLAGMPKYQHDRLQRIQNNAARLVFKSSKHDHVTPLLHSLHWLPVSKRIDYKLCTLCFSVVSETAPEYLSELFTIYTPSRDLRSSSDTRLFRIPSCRTKTNGQRSFSFQAPTVWNTLPKPLRESSSTSSFKSSLKTFLFKH